MRPYSPENKNSSLKNVRELPKRPWRSARTAKKLSYSSQVQAGNCPQNTRMQIYEYVKGFIFNNPLGAALSRSLNPILTSSVWAPQRECSPKRVLRAYPLMPGSPKNVPSRRPLMSACARKALCVISRGLKKCGRILLPMSLWCGCGVRVKQKWRLGAEGKAGDARPE